MLAASTVAAAAEHPVRVLFVCEHGVAKSMMAARLFERMARERGVPVEVTSRGVVPESRVPPALVEAMAKDGFAVAAFEPRKLTDADAAAADRIVTFGLDITPPPGRAIERWDVPAVSENYVVARDAIVARLRSLLDRIAPARP